MGEDSKVVVGCVSREEAMGADEGMVSVALADNCPVGEEAKVVVPSSDWDWRLMKRKAEPEGKSWDWVPLTDG